MADEWLADEWWNQLVPEQKLAIYEAHREKACEIVSIPSEILQLIAGYFKCDVESYFALRETCKRTAKVLTNEYNKIADATYLVPYINRLVNRVFHLHGIR